MSCREWELASVEEKEGGEGRAMAPYVAVGLALGPQIGNFAVQASVGLFLRRIGIHNSTNVLALRIDLRDVCGNVLRARRGGEKRDGECGERQAGESLVQHLLRRSSRSLACRRCAPANSRAVPSRRASASNSSRHSLPLHRSLPFLMGPALYASKSTRT